MRSGVFGSATLAALALSGMLAAPSGQSVRGKTDVELDEMDRREREEIERIRAQRERRAHENEIEFAKRQEREAWNRAVDERKKAKKASKP